MKKHFYLHTSKFDIIESLKRDAMFVPCCNYDQLEKLNQHQYEYGVIETEQSCYHIILQSRTKQKFCPWCGFVPELKIQDDSTKIYRKVLYFECPKCMSRGPMFNALERIQDEKDDERLKDFVYWRYQERLPWDFDLVNKYISCTYTTK